MLSAVAREAIADLARKESWRLKRHHDYETAVSTLIFAVGRDPDLAEVTPEVAGRYVRDLTWSPSNVTKRKAYAELPTFAERVAAAKAAEEGRVLDPVTINGKYLTPLRQIYEWRRLECPWLVNPFTGIRAEKPRKADPRKERRDFSPGEICRLFDLPLFTGAAYTASAPGLSTTRSIGRRTSASTSTSQAR